MLKNGMMRANMKMTTTKNSNIIVALESTYAWRYICDNKYGKENIQILDYSPSNNHDIEWLLEKGYNAESFTPNKDTKPNKKFDIIISKYLLNKIDNEDDRNNALYEIAKHSLCDGTMFLVSSKRKEKKLSDYIIESNKHFTIYMI